MTSIIQTSVLRAAVLSAFDRGRYSVTFATTPAGDDLAVVPSAIILNLEERDDDLLGSEPFELFSQCEESELRREVGLAMNGLVSRDVAEKLSRMDLSKFYGADDHGPAVPAQDGHGCRGEDLSSPKVYDFAFQDAVPHYGFFPAELIDVTQNHAPDYVAASNADWVHVYDRVTRERRTLKRPGADRIVKGLADVAADLRGKPTPPAPGPLTSADGLMNGDVVMCRSKPSSPFLGRVSHITKDRHAAEIVGHNWASFCNVSDCSFVGRPDADGWMDWPGGENPVDEAMVEVMHPKGGTGTCKATALRWHWAFNGLDGGDIVRFRLVDLPSLPSDT